MSIQRDKCLPESDTESSNENALYHITNNMDNDNDNDDEIIYFDDNDNDNDNATKQTIKSDIINNNNKTHGNGIKTVNVIKTHIKYDPNVPIPENPMTPHPSFDNKNNNKTKINNSNNNNNNNISSFKSKLKSIQTPKVNINDDESDTCDTYEYSNDGNNTTDDDDINNDNNSVINDDDNKLNKQHSHNDSNISNISNISTNSNNISNIFDKEDQYIQRKKNEGYYHKYNGVRHTKSNHYLPYAYTVDNNINNNDTNNNNNSNGTTLNHHEYTNNMKNGKSLTDKRKSNSTSYSSTYSSNTSNFKKLKRGEEHFPKEQLCNRYEFVRYLGHGAYGYVCEGKCLKTNRKVAIKKIMRIFNNKIDAKRLLRELRILRTLQGHDSIVELIDILPPNDFSNFNQLILVFEFVDTDLAKLIQSDQFFTKLHIQYMLYQILLGLKYMHSANIYHRDLKPANILVKEDCTLKICDFGLARFVLFDDNRLEDIHEFNKTFINNYETSNVNTKPGGAGMIARTLITKRDKKTSKRQLTAHVVTRWYRAPEVILVSQKREYLSGIDMWSVGCIFGELLQMLKDNTPNYKLRKPIFPGSSCFPLSANDPFAYNDRMDQLNVIFGVIGTPTPEELNNIYDKKSINFLKSIKKKKPVNLKKLYPNSNDESLSLLRGLLQFDTSKRININESLLHPYLKKVRDIENEKIFDNSFKSINKQKKMFEFEEIKLSINKYRQLIIKEIIIYNPNLNIKSDIV